MSRFNGLLKIVWVLLDGNRILFGTACQTRVNFARTSLNVGTGQVLVRK